MNNFFEKLFFNPGIIQYFIILVLLPFSILYGLLMLLRRLMSQSKDFGLPVVSVGNLIAGGSGKTPFVIVLASRYENVCVISRGYGRQSQGLIEVSSKGKILTDVKHSGDEAMLMAVSLPKASVIVSEKREEAIALAKKQGSKLIILDDGFNRVEIKKFEIILEPEKINNPFPFPAGPFREFSFVKHYADIVAKEGKDFKRVVNIEPTEQKMMLATAISNPKRLDQYLPKNVVGKVYLEDHAYFDEASLMKDMQKYRAERLLVTQKDAVKMRDFKLPLSIMKLKLEIQSDIVKKIDEYIKKY